MNPTKWIEDCEREPIHAPGCIQPWGALLVAHQADQTVRYASANLGAFIGQSAADAIGQTLATLLAGCADHPDLTITQHRLGELLYADIEWAEPGGPGATAAEAWVSARRVIEVLRGARSSAELFTVAVDEIRRATGFDRAMFYRFDPVGHGEVVAETCVDGLEPLLGIHYPASDVPRQARRLYLRQLVRVIGDVDAVPVPLLGGGDLVGRVDLSPSALRAVAPIHLTYLRNMGVAATAAVSITMDQALSGLLVCHHRQPRVLPPGARAVCDLIGQVTSLMLATLRASEARAALTARRARILGISARLGGCGDGAAGLAAGLADAAADLLSLCGASGAICRLGGRIIWAGDAPAGAAATGLLNALLAAAAASGGSGAEPFASQALHATLGQDALCELPPHLAGALLLPIPPTPGDAIVWLRPEQAHTVTWGGDPRRPTEFDAASGGGARAIHALDGGGSGWRAGFAARAGASAGRLCRADARRARPGGP
jgi:light-regulated signal transduction histidine kinase (bacteriophytochrome)